MLKPDVAKAIEEIRAAFPGKELLVEEDGSGGASLVLENIDLGPPYAQATSWVGFQVTFQYPHADVYPHFVRSDLTRSDGRPLGEGTSPGQSFMRRSAIQISRRSNRLNPATDTALLKLLKVIEWLKS